MTKNGNIFSIFTRNICFNLSYLSALHTNLVLSAAKELHSKGCTCYSNPY